MGPIFKMFPKNLVLHVLTHQLPIPDLHSLIEFAFSVTPSPTPTSKSPSPVPRPAVRPAKPRRPRKPEPIVLDDQPLVLYASQRGKHLLVLENYTFSKNNTVADTTYWACRVVTNHVKCKARASTTRKLNGLFRIVLGNATHNHLPKMASKILLEPADEPNVFYMKS